MVSRKVMSSLKNHGHHFIFGLSILSLTALTAWWSIFIHNSIIQQRLHHYDAVASELRYYSLKLGEDKEQIPVLGVLPADDRFEIVLCGNTQGDFSGKLEPYWSEYCIQPRSEFLEQIEAESKRLNFMLIGEAAVFLLIIFVCCIFLYQYIRLERRTAQEIRQFWERTAHEIKTPITGIKAFLQNLKSRALDLQELEPYVDLALKQVKKQEKLAENILSGNRLKPKAARLALERINLNEFLREYFNEESLTLADLKTKLHFEKDTDIPVMVNTQALRVILDNIADNAVKYASPEPALTVEIFTEKKNAVMTFQDNGPGIPVSLAQNIFHAYKLPDEKLPIRRQGAGMGLYISQQLARSMRGDIKVLNQGKDKGAKICVYLCLT